MKKLALLTIVTLLVLPGVSPAAPENDSWPGTQVTTLPHTATLTMSYSTKQSGEPKPSCVGNNGTVWFNYTAATNEQLVASAENRYQSAIAVYTGTSLRNLDEINCQYLAYAGQQATVIISATPGTTYYFQISSVGYISDGDTGTFKLAAGESPVNDDFAAAKIIDSFPAATNGSSDALATLEPGEPVPSCSGHGFGRTSWFSWTPDFSGTVTFDRLGSHFLNIAAVYTGSSIGALTERACIAYSAIGRLDVSEGTEYRIQAGSLLDSAGNSALNLNPLEPGDDFSDAIPVAADSTTAVDLTRSTRQFGEPQTCGYQGTKWLKMAGHAGVVRVSAPYQSPYPIIAVYDGDWSHQISCTYSWQEPAHFEAQAGHTYYIAVATYYYLYNTAPAQITLTSIPAPPNDEAAGAKEMIGAPSVAVGDNFGSTHNGEAPPSCGRGVGATNWYTWTAPQERDYVVDTVGSSFDTVLAVYEGSSSADLGEIKCNDDHNDQTSRVIVHASAGQRFWFLVGGYQQKRGAVSVNVDTEMLNDDFAEARTVAGSIYSDTSHNLRATVQPNEPRPTCNSANQTLATEWYRFDSIAGGLVTVDTLGSSVDTIAAVYAGLQIQDLTQVACSNDIAPGTTSSALTFTAIPGTTYWIQVGGWRRLYPYTTDPDVAHGSLVVRVLSLGI